MFCIAPRCAGSPQSKRGRLQLLSHELDDLARLKSKLNPNGIEGRPIFPSHLDDPIGLGRRQILHVQVSKSFQISGVGIT